MPAAANDGDSAIPDDAPCGPCIFLFNVAFDDKGVSLGVTEEETGRGVDVVLTPLALIALEDDDESAAFLLPCTVIGPLTIM